MVDAEDVRTEMFALEKDELESEERDLALVKSDQIVASEALGEDVDDLTAADVLSRIVRTMQREGLTAPELARAMVADSSDEMSITELERVLLDKLGVLLSPVESSTLLRVLDEDCNGMVSVAEFVAGLQCRPNKTCPPKGHDAG